MLSELFIEPRLELREAPGQLPVRAEQFAQLHEGPHDVHTHLDGPWAVQNGGRHDGAVLSESVRQVLAVLSASSL